jgi:murein DD-endopeptidase MepM/ murein hydrolase activator NlpD
MTLYSLARTYHVPLPDLMQANRITDPTTIPEGTVILIPGVSRPLPPPAPALPGLAWPLRGSITSGFGTRGRRAHHKGVDIDGDQGDLIFAAASGTVIEAESEHEYGRVVVIDHGHGLSTLYAHADRLLVKPGQTVRQGQAIARVGRTGNARGSHLHFEVRRDGQAVNPLPLLESGSMTAQAARPRKAPPRPAQAAILPR